MLKWVGTESEAEIRAAFARALAVPGKGLEAREMAVPALASRNADKLVKAIMHRVGEGIRERFVRVAAVKRGAESKGRERR